MMGKSLIPHPFRRGGQRLLIMRNVLRSAIALHTSGQLEQAAELYRSVLARDRANAEALHWFGVLHHQLGDHAGAVELIRRAVALRGEAYLYHGNLAEAYRAAGDHANAAASCRTALRLWPDYPEALCTLGTSLQAMGQHPEAIEFLRRAVVVRPGFVVAHNNLGIALRAMGQHEEALAAFRRAVELDPAFAPGRSNLGQALLNAGQAEAALPHCEEAVRLDPNSAELHDNLGNVLRTLDRLDDAWAEHWKALHFHPQLAPAHAHIGLILHRRGHLAEARAWLEQAVALELGEATFWQWLAELHDEREDPAASIPCWERVRELDPRRVSAHLALGRAYQEDGRLADAERCYQAALELEPDSGAAYLNVGWVHELLGALDQAEAAFREAMRRQPQFALPHARLATLLRGKLPEGDLAALEERLADPELADAPRARLLFGLAHVLDARGDYARAADCLARANALALEASRERRAYDPSEHEQYVGGLVRAFDRGLFTRLAGAGAGAVSRRPVFVFGLPRSGTTLVEQVLASHALVHGAGELRLARQSFEAIPGVLGRSEPPRDCIAHLEAAAVRTLAARHLDRLASLDGGQTPRIVDKMPENYLYLGLLAILFPRAVFIHCRRDLRDVAVSCWMTDFSSIRWANDFGHIAARFHQYRRMMDHWRGVLPMPIHEVDYQETVTDLEAVARRLVDAIGLEWDPACLEFHRTERPVRTASVTQVRQPVYTRSLARWKNYESELGELFAALAGDDGNGAP
jgi:tetratricopeptide (TPR) repeat protein